MATILTLKLLWLRIQTENGFRHPHNTFTEDKINRQRGQLNNVICVLTFLFISAVGYGVTLTCVAVLLALHSALQSL